jgi:hypothetical protein
MDGFLVLTHPHGGINVLRRPRLELMTIYFEILYYSSKKPPAEKPAIGHQSFVRIQLCRRWGDPDEQFTVWWGLAYYEAAQ